MNQFSVPCASFKIAAVIKILSTFLKTSVLNTAPKSPEPFQAMITIAYEEHISTILPMGGGGLAKEKKPGQVIYLKT